MLYFTDILRTILTKDAVRTIALKIGASDKETEWAIETVNALVIAFLAKQTTTLQSTTALSKVLDRNKDGSITDDIQNFVSNLAKGKIDTAEGKEMVEDLFTEHSQEVLQLICIATGLTTGGATTVLMAIAPLVIKAVAEEQQKRGWSFQQLEHKLSSATTNANHAVTDKVLQLFDKNKDGKIADDICSTVRNLFKKRA